MKPGIVEPAIPIPAAEREVRPAAGAGTDAAARHPRYDYWAVVASHALVDVFPMFITSLMIVLQDRLALSRGQETAVWIATPIFSGLLQPLFAWLGDRYDTRLAGPLGLAVGAVCIGSIGFAQSFWQLITLQIVGVIGVGIYHPTAAAVAGQTGTRALCHGRAFALSLFVASGMVGHTLGPIVATRVNDWFGIVHLAWVIPPTLVVCVLLHLATRDAPHRPHDHHELRAALTPGQARRRWYAAALLSGQNALRYTVNVGMFILFNYWASSRIPDDPDAAAVLNGNLTAAMTIGMGAGALLAGRFLRPGTEKIAFAVTAVAGAFFVGAINVAGDWGQAMFDTSAMAMIPAYVAAALAAVGFFATIPASVGLGQRLLPSHTSLVTAILLGVGWMIGALARPISSAFLGGIKLDEAWMLTDTTLNRAFVGFAVLLALAGVLALMMPAQTLREAARQS
ncbi:MAG: MFS transporter [Planctomycetota bacterium]|jgi:FSR family fosmidomycin resistance protein-like MFS transporter